MSFTQVLILIGMSMLPVVELRGSIPYGLLLTDFSWPFVVLVCASANWLLAPLLYGMLRLIVRVLVWWPWLFKQWIWYQQHSQRRLHAYVDKYGFWGLALFIAVPLPGTGVFSGTVAAYALGMHVRVFLLSALLGVALSAAVITALVLTGSAFVT